MTITLISCLLFLWIYNWNKLRNERQFNKFLRDENWEQRKVVVSSQRVVNDSCQYMETMCGITDKAGYIERKKIREKNIVACQLVLEKINQLNKNDEK